MTSEQNCVETKHVPTTMQTVGSEADAYEITIHDLAKRIFLGVDRQPVALVLEGTETTKDLFCFLVDLLRRGLAITYGRVAPDGTRVVVDLVSLTPEEFDVVRQRLRTAGIDVLVDVYDNDAAEPSGHDLAQVVATMPDDLDLDRYRVRLVARTRVYDVRFRAIRPPAFDGCKS